MSINGIEWILIIVVALILFGPKKLPELGRAVGKSIREFKRATNGILNDDESSKGTEAKAENKTVQDEVKKTSLNEADSSKGTETKVESKTVKDEAKQPNL